MLIVLKFGSLSLLQPSGPVQACNGIALPFSSNTSPPSSTLCWDMNHTLPQCKSRCTLSKRLFIRRFCIKIEVSRRCWDIFHNSATNTEKGLLPPPSGWIMMKAAGSSETLVHIYQTTHYSIPEECDWVIHDHVELKTDDNVTNGNQTHTLLVPLVCRHSHLQWKILLLPFLIQVTHVYQFVLQLLHGPHLTCQSFSLHQDCRFTHKCSTLKYKHYS